MQRIIDVRPCAARMNQSPIRRVFLALGFVSLFSAIPIFGQNSDLQQKVAAVKQSAAENKQKLLQYQWTETTQLSLKGDLKPPTKNSCRYGPDGQVQKTAIGAPPQQQPSGGRVKQKVVEKKKAEMKDYMDDVKAVIGMYVPPDPGRMQAAFQAGNVALNPTAGVVNLVFSNYAQPNDKMTLTYDQASKKITALNIETYMGQEKDKVTMEVRMGTLPDGTNYTQQTVLNATAKQLIVTTTNSDYQKL